jgi:hypothetical protein
LFALDPRLGVLGVLGKQPLRNRVELVAEVLSVQGLAHTRKVGPGDVPNLGRPIA